MNTINNSNLDGNSPRSSSYSYIDLDESIFQSTDLNNNKPVLTEKYIESNYEIDYLKSNNILSDSVNYVKKYYKPSKNCCKNFLCERMPILGGFKY
jgi:hypothetical protein